MRKTTEINAYVNEAFDKVWLMRSHPSEDLMLEAARRECVEKIINRYPDIPENGYSDFECGYWNGILAALRWVLGEEKDSLDT